MIRLACITAALALGLISPSAAENAPPDYDFRERTRALAFDPALFFPKPSQPAMSVRYMGDDYGFPVYAIAVNGGCIAADQGEARQTCSQRLRARMVRSPFRGVSPRPRARGQRLFARIGQSKPQNDDALRLLLDNGGLEWLEADVVRCPAAMAHLATGRNLKFSPSMDQIGQPQEIGLHADKITFEVGGYLAKSRYEGWPKPGTPGAWANDFVASLERCWKPATAPAPWRVLKR
jgi:hypothetical protein